MKKIYCVVLSELDEYGNRNNAWEMSSDISLSKAKKEKRIYQQKIDSGEFKELSNNLIAELEIREFESNDLIEII